MAVAAAPASAPALALTFEIDAGDSCVGGVARWTWHTGRDGRCDAGAGRATLARPHRWQSTSSRGQGHPAAGCNRSRAGDRATAGGRRALAAACARWTPNWSACETRRPTWASNRPAWKSRLAAAIELAAVKGGAFDLVEEVRALRLVPAALLLREAAESGRPFAPALDQFAAVVAQVDSAYLEADPPVMEQIASLQPYAETGVLSWRDLRRSFASLAGLIDRADPLSWWDWALVVAGWRDDPLAPLHEAQAALMVDDLEGAIASLAAFQGEAALVTEGWLALARARLAADALWRTCIRLHSLRARARRLWDRRWRRAATRNRRSPDRLSRQSGARCQRTSARNRCRDNGSRTQFQPGDSHCARASMRRHALVAAYGSGRPLSRNCTC